MLQPRAVCSTLLATLVVCQLLFAAHGSLMAIDLGSEYLKVCLVKPGRTPISIVVNEMSRRKSPALVGLVEEERVLGEEAYSLSIRYPNSIFSQLRNLLGRSSSDGEVKRVLEENLLPYTVVDHPSRGTIALPYNETTKYLVEELVAGIFQYSKQITDAQAGEPVIDTVIVVPAWFGIAQRQATIDAATLAGLNVLGLINSHSAAALQYGIERDFAKKEQKVILYDMGSGSTEVALVKYSTYGKAGSSGKGLINQFEVLDVEWDHGLGSNTLDLLLAEHFAKEFEAKHGVDVRLVPKSMAKLRRQVRRTKEMLSANTAAPISVEELHGGKDFQSSISREEFEKLAGPFWKRAAAPLSRLLQRNQLAAKDVDAVELLGGGSRVPKLQAVLSDALGGRHLDRHLDADEAVVLGAGLFAANLSSSFRLRKFGMTDVAAFGVTFESHDLFTPAVKLDEAAAAAGAGGKKSKSKKDSKKAAAVKDEETVEATGSSKSGHVVKSLLPAGKKLPIKRAIKYTNLTIDGFSFELRYNASTPHGLPPGVTEPSLGSYTVSGIEDAIKRYNQSGVTTLRFEADYSSLLHFSSAECVIETETLEEKIIEVPAPLEEQDGTSSDPAAAGADKKSEKQAESAEEKGEGAEEAAAANDTDVTAGNATAAAAGNKTTIKMVKKTIQVPRRRVYHVALNVSGSGPTYTPLSGDTLTTALAHVSAWRVAEAVKAATAKAKNDLEAYIISTKEKLETDELVQQVTAESARVKFTEQLTEAEDWLYGDGEHEAADAFVEKLKGLKAVGDPITRRAAELELRPKVLDAIQQSVAAAENITSSWADTKPWISDNETQEAVDKISGFKKWLQEQEAAQAKKELTDEPAFTGMDVLTKWETVQKLIKKIDGKKRPKPKAVPKNETDSTAAGSGSSTGDGAAAADEGDADAAAEGGKSEGEGSAEAGEAATNKKQQQQQQEDEELPAHEEL